MAPLRQATGGPTLTGPLRYARDKGLRIPPELLDDPDSLQSFDPGI